MTIDPEASPHSRMVSTLLGKYKIPEVSLPPLDLSTLLLPLRLLEEISGISDLLMDLSKIALLISTPGLIPLVSSSPSLSGSAGSLVAPPLVPSSAPPAAIEQLSMLTIDPPISLLQTSPLEKVMIPAAQAASLFEMVLPATLL